MDNLITSLQKIGLSENESRIYIAVTKLGDSAVKDISTESGVKRPTTYLALDDLRQKGLITKIPHAKRAIYRAKDIDDLYDFASDNMNEFKRSLPTLESLSTTNKPIRALYFEGLQGMRDAMFYKIEDQKNKTITMFGGKDVGFSDSYLNLIKKWSIKLSKLNIHIKGVVPDDNSQHKNKEIFPGLYESIKFIPESEYSSEISIDTTDKFVRFVDGVEMKAVIIESERMAKTVQDIFNLTIKKNIS
jgi:sugar-specific transcriptional regulator TrmB